MFQTACWYRQSDRFCVIIRGDVRSRFLPWSGRLEPLDRPRSGISDCGSGRGCGRGDGGASRGSRGRGDGGHGRCNAAITQVSTSSTFRARGWLLWEGCRLNCGTVVSANQRPAPAPSLLLTSCQWPLLAPLSICLASAWILRCEP